MSKVSWSKEEDAELCRLVEKHGARNWPEIAAGIIGRSGKSCRLRWCNQLNPNVDHRPFTPEEDEVIVRLHAEHGNKWAAIARLLPGRSDNAVKNHFNSTLRRLKRRRIGEGSGATRVQELETDLTLMPPGGGGLVEEGFGVERNRACYEDRDLDRRLEEVVFKMGLQKMIAEEVRKYMDEFVNQSEGGFVEKE